MKKIQKIGALNFAICQFVADLMTESESSPLHINRFGFDIHKLFTRMGLNIKVTHFKLDELVEEGPFQGQRAKFCQVIITPINWKEDSFIECIFFSLTDNRKNNGWWAYRGNVFYGAIHQAFRCEPDVMSGQTEFRYHFFEMMV